MALLERIERDMAELAKSHEAAMSTLRGRKKQVIRRFLIRCRECRVASRLSSWGFVQKMYYVRPSGCTEGDYWVPRDTETCDIVCPKCGERNYIYNHPQKERIVAVATRGIGKDELFAAVEKVNDPF